MRRIALVQTRGKPDSKYMDDAHFVKVVGRDGKVTEVIRYTRHQMKNTTQTARQNIKRLWKSLPHNKKPNLVLAAGYVKQRRRQQEHRDRVANDENIRL
ncbi:MAG: hypothetical protein V3T23_11335 [Nitrososphaerales archaeon]